MDFENRLMQHGVGAYWVHWFWASCLEFGLRCLYKYCN